MMIVSLLSAGALLYAQGKVGINTSTPAETIEINGTTKIADLPTNGTGKVYGGLNNKNKTTTFNATRTVVADANGVLGTVAGIPSEQRQGGVEFGVSCVKATGGNTDFGEYPAGVVEELNMGEYSFAIYLNTPKASTGGTKIVAKNNTSTVDYRIGKNFAGSSGLSLNFTQYTPGVWTNASSNFAWDTEDTGEYLFFGGDKEENTVYRITFWSQKRLASSSPQVCILVQGVSDN